jgi:hypothetical protein
MFVGPNGDRHCRDGGYQRLGTGHMEGIGGKSPTLGTTTALAARHQHLAQQRAFVAASLLA